MSIVPHETEQLLYYYFIKGKVCSNERTELVLRKGNLINNGGTVSQSTLELLPVSQINTNYSELILCLFALQIPARFVVPL